MSKFYVIRGEYQPNSAPYNRLNSFLGIFEQYGIKTELVFLFPNWDGTKPYIRYKNVNTTYLYEKNKIFNNRILAKLFSWVITRQFVNKLNAGDKVFICDGCLNLGPVQRKKGVEVYREVTEHPDVLVWRFKLSKLRFLQSCKKLSGLFVISTSLKNYFTRIGVPEKKITIVNMTVDPNRFENVSKSTSVEKYIAYCGTASNNKDGVDRLIKAFAIVAQKHKDVKLYIIGRTPSSDDASGNLQLVDSLGIKDRVVFTGVVLAEQMPQLLTNAIILALARPNNLQAQNGFPTKLGEYLLTRNPVVVTKVGDIPLFLKDGDNALLVDPDNIEAFAEKLCWVLEHPDEAKMIGEKGRDVAIASFNSTIETNKILNVILREYDKDCSCR